MRFFHMSFLCLVALILTGCFAKTNTAVNLPGPVVDESVPAVVSQPEEVSSAVAEASPEDTMAETLLNGVDVELVDDSAEPLDAETLADNQLLQNKDQVPPEELGETVEHQEPVYDFPMVENDKVRYFIDYYTGRARKTFKIWLERSARYLPMMQEVFAEKGLPRDLAYLAMVESGFNAKAYSWAHAVGPWQFIESTGKRYGLKNDWWQDERRDPEKATRSAANFLADLYEDFDSDWYLAVPSYNAGPGKLRQAIKRYKTRDFWEICRGKYLKTETKNYVPKLLAVIMIAKEPEKYGFEDLEYHEPLAYETVPLPSSTDIEVIARLTGSDYQTIKQLNPELKRWSTPPGVKDYLVHLPLGTADTFLAQYAELPKHKRANYVRHKVKSGDTLLAMSKRYGVRVSDIQKLNNIRNARALQIGQNLIVPLNPDANGKTALSALKDDYKRSRRTYYTVRSGDSLWKISNKFGVTEKQLRVWNRLGWSNVIRPGQRLIVSSKAAPVKKAAVKNSGPLKEVVYKVRPGDTLWAIGQEFAVATNEILRWNNLDANHILQPGERLTLHVSSSRG